jgi:hypothetical protein
MYKFYYRMLLRRVWPDGREAVRLPSSHLARERLPHALQGGRPTAGQVPAVGRPAAPARQRVGFGVAW